MSLYLIFSILNVKQTLNLRLQNMVLTNPQLEDEIYAYETKHTHFTKATRIDGTFYLSWFWWFLLCLGYLSL